MSSPAQKRVVLRGADRAVPANASHIGRTDPNQIISVSVIVKRKNPWICTRSAARSSRAKISTHSLPPIPRALKGSASLRTKTA